MSAPLPSRLLVTRASGYIGRRTVELLLEAGAENLIAASRYPEMLSDLASRGAEIRKADFDDPATLDLEFAGVERLLIVSTDALGVPGKRQRQHRAAVDAAVKAGVGHIIYTSMSSPEPGSLMPFAPDHYETERALERSGVPFTVLRVNCYADNIFSWLPQALSSGQWFTSSGEGCAGYVTRDEAAAAAAVLSFDAIHSCRVDVTGPEALSATAVAGIVNEVFDSPIQVISVSDEQLAEGLPAAGLPASLVELLVAMDATTRTGGVDIVSNLMSFE